MNTQEVYLWNSTLNFIVKLYSDDIDQHKEYIVFMHNYLISLSSIDSDLLTYNDKKMQQSIYKKIVDCCIYNEDKTELSSLFISIQKTHLSPFKASLEQGQNDKSYQRLLENYQVKQTPIVYNEFTFLILGLMDKSISETDAYRLFSKFPQARSKNLAKVIYDIIDRYYYKTLNKTNVKIQKIISGNTIRSDKDVSEIILKISNLARNWDKFLHDVSLVKSLSLNYLTRTNNTKQLINEVSDFLSQFNSKIKEEVELPVMIYLTSLFTKNETLMGDRKYEYAMKHLFNGRYSKKGPEDINNLGTWFGLGGDRKKIDKLVIFRSITNLLKQHYIFSPTDSYETMTEKISMFFDNLITPQIKDGFKSLKTDLDALEDLLNSGEYKQYYLPWCASFIKLDGVKAKKVSYTYKNILDLDSSILPEDKMKPGKKIIRLFKNALSGVETELLPALHNSSIARKITFKFLAEYLQKQFPLLYKRGDLYKKRKEEKLLTRYLNLIDKNFKTTAKCEHFYSKYQKRLAKEIIRNEYGFLKNIGITAHEIKDGLESIENYNDNVTSYFEKFTKDKSLAYLYSKYDVLTRVLDTVQKSNSIRKFSPGLFSSNKNLRIDSWYGLDFNEMNTFELEKPNLSSADIIDLSKNEVKNEIESLGFKSSTSYLDQAFLLHNYGVDSFLDYKDILNTYDVHREIFEFSQHYRHLENELKNLTDLPFVVHNSFTFKDVMTHYMWMMSEVHIDEFEADYYSLIGHPHKLTRDKIDSLFGPDIAPKSFFSTYLTMLSEKTNFKLSISIFTKASDYTEMFYNSRFNKKDDSDLGNYILSRTKDKIFKIKKDKELIQQFKVPIELSRIHALLIKKPSPRSDNVDVENLAMDEANPYGLGENGSFFELKEVDQIDRLIFDFTDKTRGYYK
ncbi:MAG: hypothetical protein HON90_14620 [Halobacteriovoraceae bacterium]|nr:hypothetical protein [Halobacteriovoraceae bacterium]